MWPTVGKGTHNAGGAMKRRAVRLAMTVAVVLGLPVFLCGVVDAAVALYTSPILVDKDRYVRCSLTNVGTVPYVVTIDVLDIDGVSQGALTNVTVQPGHTEANVFGFSAVSICKFIVGYPSRVRAGGCVSAMGSLTCLDSSPAR